MKKSFFQFQEQFKIIDIVKGAEIGMAPPVAIRNLKIFAKQVSNALQSSPANLLARLEIELNKYGYSLGELDSDITFEDTGDEDFVLIAFPDGEEIKNVFISIKWSKTNSEIYQYSPNILSYNVKMTVNEIDPSDYDTLVNSGSIHVENDDDFEGDYIFGDDDSDLIGESAEDEYHRSHLETITNTELKRKLQSYRKTDPKKYEHAVSEFEKRGLKENTDLKESVRTKFQGKRVTITGKNDSIVSLEVTPNSLFIETTNEHGTSFFECIIHDAEKVMTTLMDHFIDKK